MPHIHKNSWICEKNRIYAEVFDCVYNRTPSLLYVDVYISESYCGGNHEKCPLVLFVLFYLVPRKVLG